MSAVMFFWVCCSTATEAFIIPILLCLAGVFRHGGNSKTDPLLHHLSGQEWRGRGVRYRGEERASIERETETQSLKKKKKRQMEMEMERAVLLDDEINKPDLVAPHYPYLLLCSV